VLDLNNPRFLSYVSWVFLGLMVAAALARGALYYPQLGAAWTKIARATLGIAGRGILLVAVMLFLWSVYVLATFDWASLS
jgi:hypothetical protein